jgi:hypothetical protein
VGADDQDPSLWQGACLATATDPVSNAVFMAALHRAAGAPFGLTAVAWRVELGAPLLLRTDPESVICGCLGASRRLCEAGFKFRFPSIVEALKDVFGH